MGSGKSILSTHVAIALGWKRVSFGDYVRGVAHQRGLKEDRETLQRIGAGLIESDAFRFCREVLYQPGIEPKDGLVVDGVRHLEILELIRAMVRPTHCRMLFIDVPSRKRADRIAVRDGTTNRELWKRFNSHSTESQGETLRGAADLVLDGNRPVETLLKDVFGYLSEQLRKAEDISGP